MPSSLLKSRNRAEKTVGRIPLDSFFGSGVTLGHRVIGMWGAVPSVGSGQIESRLDKPAQDAILPHTGGLVRKHF